MKKILYFIFYIYFFLFVVEASVKEYTIKNDTLFIQLPEIIERVLDNDVIIYFEDEYYEMLSSIDIFSFDVEMTKNVTFVGREGGTVFHYNEDKQGSIKVFFKSEKGKKFTIKNIIFDNFIENFGVSAINVFSYVSEFFVEIINCTFRNNLSPSIRIRKHYSKALMNTENVLIDNCKF